MATFEIPLSPTPQRLAIKLNGAVYQLLVIWNFASECWMISISDETGNPLAQSIPMVLGANLLEQMEYLEIGGKIIAQVDTNSGIPPTFENLGIEGHLLFEVTDA